MPWELRAFFAVVALATFVLYVPKHRPSREQLREAFERGGRRKTMDWREATIGANVGPGWEPLVDELHAEVLKRFPGVVVEQVKEKFGGLRYYVAKRSINESTSALIHEYEARSLRTCEWCGTTEGVEVKAPEGRWLKALCSSHHEAWARGERWWLA
jgi:hypothetical protein